MNGIGVLARWSTEVVWAKCIKGTECQRMTIDEEQGRLWTIGHEPSLLASTER